MKMSIGPYKASPDPAALVTVRVAGPTRRGSLEWMEADFASWLLGSNVVETFWQAHWGTSALLVRHESESYFKELLTVDMLDEILASTRLPADHFDLAKDSTPIPKPAYASGRDINMQTALRFHHDGSTIILRAFHKWCRPLDRLRRQAESTFGVPAQTNVYVTPPRNQSTPPHWDTHDLFIIQVEGTKKWRLYESARPLPLDDERFTPDQFDVGPQIGEPTLSSGDVLYLPRGSIHEPSAEDYSIHVALGVPVMRWIDLVEEILRLASREDVSLREAVPWEITPRGGPSLSSIAEEALRRVARVTDRHFADEAVRGLRREFIAGQDVDSLGKLRAIARPPRPTLESTVRRRHGALPRVETVGGRIALSWRGGRASFPKRFAGIVQLLVNQGEIRVRDVPDGISEDVWLATLVSPLDDGLLEVIEP